LRFEKRSRKKGKGKRGRWMERHGGEDRKRRTWARKWGLKPESG